MPRARRALLELLLTAFLAGCAPDGLTVPENPQRLLPALNSCSPRSDQQLPSYVSSSNLNVTAYFPCSSTVKVQDLTGNATVAAAVAALRAAMDPGSTGIPDISTSVGGNYTVHVTYTGGSGPWKGHVSYSAGVPVGINFDGSCTQDCGSLYDVALNELTQLYGMADSSGKWDGFQVAGVSDHCAALSPATKAYSGTICRFEVEAVWWLYGIIDSVPPADKHVVTGFYAPTASAWNYPSLSWSWVSGDTVNLNGIQDDNVQFRGFRPEFSLGNPTVDCGECEVNAKYLTNTWTASHWAGGNATPNGSTDSTVWGTLNRLHVSVAASPNALSWFSHSMSAPLPYRFNIWGTTVFSAAPVADFAVVGCSQEYYGGKWYTRSTLGWVPSDLPSEWGWEIVEVSIPEPSSGSVVATGSAGTSLDLPDVAQYGGPTYKYYFIRYGGSSGTAWFSLIGNPIDITACSA